MNLKQTDKLLNLLRSHHVSHFKSLEVEVRLEPHVPSQLSIVTPIAEEIPQSAAAVPATAAAAPPVEMVIPHHVNEVARIMKLGDADLVDEMFPLPKGDNPHPITGE